MFTWVITLCYRFLIEMHGITSKMGNCAGWERRPGWKIVILSSPLIRRGNLMCTLIMQLKTAHAPTAERRMDFCSSSQVNLRAKSRRCGEGRPFVCVCVCVCVNLKAQIPFLQPFPPTSAHQIIRSSLKFTTHTP